MLKTWGVGTNGEWGEGEEDNENKKREGVTSIYTEVMDFNCTTCKDKFSVHTNFI